MTVSLAVLNALIKRVNDQVQELGDKPLSDVEKVVALSELQGVMLTVSSEAMALVADIAKLIGSTTSASTAESLVKELLGAIDEKAKDSN